MTRYFIPLTKEALDKCESLIKGDHDGRRRSSWLSCKYCLEMTRKTWKYCPKCGRSQRRPGRPPSAEPIVAVDRAAMNKNETLRS